MWRALSCPSPQAFPDSVDGLSAWVMRYLTLAVVGVRLEEVSKQSVDIQMWGGAPEAHGRSPIALGAFAGRPGPASSYSVSIRGFGQVPLLPRGGCQDLRYCWPTDRSNGVVAHRADRSPVGRTAGSVCGVIWHRRHRKEGMLRAPRPGGRPGSIRCRCVRPYGCRASVQDRGSFSIRNGLPSR